MLWSGGVVPLQPVLVFAPDMNSLRGVLLIPSLWLWIRGSVCCQVIKRQSEKKQEKAARLKVRLPLLNSEFAGLGRHAWGNMQLISHMWCYCERDAHGKAKEGVGRWSPSYGDASCYTAPSRVWDAGFVK
jgi:hypothetical protein